MSFLNSPAVPKFRHALLAVLVSAGLASASSAGTAQRLEAVSGEMSGLPASAPGGFANRCGQVLLAAAPSAAQPSADMALWSANDGGKAWTEGKVRVSPWAANAAWDQRVIVAGGISEGKPTAKVLVVEADPDGVLTASELPPLPRPLAGAGAVVMDGFLYVFGGMSSAGPVVFEKTLWKLPLADGGNQAWSEAAAFPGEPGAFFSVTSQYGMMCVFGGLRKYGEGFQTSGESWIYRPKPIEGTSFTGWKRAGDLPAPAAAAAVVPLGQAGVLVAGGIRTPQVASVPPAVPDGAAKAWLYHTITDAWCPFDKDLPASGPLVADASQDVWLIGRDASWKISFPRSVRNLALIDYIVVIGNVVALGSTGTRGTGYLFKQGDMVKDGITEPFDCEGNIAVDCKVGFEFVTVKPHQGAIANNAAVACRSAFNWREVKNGRTVPAKEYSTGPHAIYQQDPGFNNPAALDYGLRGDCSILKDMPAFQAIPFDLIGLRIDEYRKTLPPDSETGRTGKPTTGAGLGYDILDRK